MSILWCGQEDIDFPVNAGIAVQTSSQYKRATARAGLGFTSGRSTAFSGGAITAGWVSFVIYRGSSYASKPFLGLGLTTQPDRGLYVGNGTTSTQLVLYKYDGTTWTLLATEAGNSSIYTALSRIDMQLVDYDSSSTINLYCNGALVLTYTGDLTITDVANFNCVCFSECSASNTISEVIVADEDTRTFILNTNAPSAAGDANEGTGAYTTVDETTIDDSDVWYSNTNDHDVQYGLTNTPAGTYAVRAVKVSARAAKSASSTPSEIRLGVRSDGSNDVDAGQAVTTGWATYERLMATDPVASADWTTAVVDALQVAMQIGA